MGNFSLQRAVLWSWSPAAAAWEARVYVAGRLAVTRLEGGVVTGSLAPVGIPGVPAASRPASLWAAAAKVFAIRFQGQ